MLPPWLLSGARLRAKAARAVAQVSARRRALLIPLGIALATRALVLVGAELSLKWAQAAHIRSARYTGEMRVWLRKDTGWYLTIAQSGYTYSPRVNFFPLYPGLIATLAPSASALHAPEPYALTGMLISWVAFAGACVALYQLTLTRFGPGVAAGATTLLATFPFSLYYGAIYTESIYLMLAVGAFLAVERGQWWLAGALAGIVSASRPPGLLIGACVALAYLLDWWRTRHALRADVLALALTPLGVLGYLLYCWVRFGDPLAYLTASRAGWNGGHMQLAGVRYIARVLWHSIAWIGTRDPNHILTLFAILAMLGFLALTPLVWRRLGPVYAVFTVASILAPILDFPTANSLGRYLSVIFPVFIVVAYALRDHAYLRWGLYIIGALLLIPFATYFIAGFGLS